MISLQELLALGLYVVILLIIAGFSFRRDQTSTDFTLGARSMNYWLTALAAHASDMSSWLLMGFPAVIFAKGLFHVWLAIGLMLFMFLNWIIIAPRVRMQTERYGCLTLSSFFASRFCEAAGTIRIFTAMASFAFYTIYICAGLVGLGLLIQSLFGIDYSIGISVAMPIVVVYLFVGGYVTLAWLDFFQGIFLLFVVAIVPLIILPKVGGFSGIAHAFDLRGLALSMMPDPSQWRALHIFSAICGWGIGYFGQPHIITKFMGIRHPREMRKSMAIGMSWQCIALGAATFIGILAIPFFARGIGDPQLVFIEMVRETFSPFVGAFILCAVLAATISTMDSQILVLASTLTEDFYKTIFRRSASSRELLWVSRASILAVALMAYLVAFFQVSTIYSLVFYAWSGLGSAFGPLLIFSLFSKSIDASGAWAGILVGGSTAILWPLANAHMPVPISPLIPGFLFSSSAIFFVPLCKRYMASLRHKG